MSKVLTLTLFWSLAFGLGACAEGYPGPLLVEQSGGAAGFGGNGGVGAIGGDAGMGGAGGMGGMGGSGGAGGSGGSGGSGGTGGSPACNAAACPAGIPFLNTACCTPAGACGLQTLGGACM